jgi:hypothetical protein
MAGVCRLCAANSLVKSWAALGGRRPARFTSGLVRLHDARWLPSSVAGRKDGGRRFLRPIEAHDEVDEVVRRGEPVAFLVRAGVVLLDVERQRAVRVFLHAGQHGRVDKVTVNRILNQELRLPVIHRDRPEGVAKPSRSS